MPRGIPPWTSNFNRFLINFCTQLGPPNLEKSSPRCRESTIFQKITFRNRHRFLIDFGANLAPFFLPKSTKIIQKSDPKRHSKIDRFLHRFFEGPRRPKSPQDGDSSAKTAPRSAPRRPQEGPKTRIAIVRFRVWPPRALQIPPDPLRTPSGPPPDALRTLSGPPPEHDFWSSNIKHTSQTNSVSKTYQTHQPNQLRGG